ncbi:MAG: hypothetical protein WBO00_08695, partial [Steroidobacteraceae bacterium]
MNAESVLERIAASHAGQVARMAGGAAWARRREHALARVLKRGLPDRRDENWKYLDHAKIAERAFDVLPRNEVTAGQIAPWLLPVPDARRLVLIDGRHEPALSDPEPAAGVM